MKKVLAVALVVMTAVALTSAAWAQDDLEDSEIRRVVREVWPHAAIYSSYPATGGVKVEIFNPRPKVDKVIFFFPTIGSGTVSMVISEESSRIFAAEVRKVEKKIFQILNRPASEALGRDLLK